jgi:hypothetical protein
MDTRLLVFSRIEPVIAAPAYLVSLQATLMLSLQQKRQHLLAI